MPPKPLPAEGLYRTCDVKAFGFDSTAELPTAASEAEAKTEADFVLGQDRAMAAIAFGAEMAQDGYNLFVLGPPGLGKHSAVQAMLRAKAAGAPTPHDWIYVHNFATPHRPKAIALTPGKGRELRDALHRLIDDIRTAIPAAFESEDYQKRREAIQDEVQEQQEASFETLRDHAEAKSIALLRTPMGFALAPVREGKVLRPEEFQKLPEEERKRIQEDSAELQNELEAMLKQLPRLQKQRMDRIRALNEEITAFVVGHPIEDLTARFADQPAVVEHLAEVRSDLIENVHKMIGAERSLEQNPAAEAGDLAAIDNATLFTRYEANLIVTAETSGAPLIYEDHPTMPRLLGRIEHIARFGALVTDFSLIKAGALHRANGGYLILDARELLVQPFAWDMLKRALSSGQIAIESPLEAISLVSTVSLEPAPIPLSVKVVLIGERRLYYLLTELEPAFARLFKVAADFEETVARDGKSEAALARLLARAVQREKLMPFASPALARIVEEMSRHAEDSRKISIMLGRADDLLREADHFAACAGATAVEPLHVEQAVAAREHRGDRLRKLGEEAIARGILLIRSEGESVGQVNGLTVLQLADFAFGRPTRISAQVRLGGGKILDIEREVELGGPIHSKGVLILSGFLAGHFALEAPLSIAATLVFEQSYGGVEGDSASCAELFALLSAIGQVPLKQSLAVTGSLNQHGEVQAIGGVNEKIEGFFEICAARGLTGDQGVLIPAANVEHLMLRPPVREACRNGRFAIYPIGRVEEGLELLTGRPAGKRGDQGRGGGAAYPEDTVYRAVEERLKAFAEARRGFGRAAGDGPEAPGGTA